MSSKGCVVGQVTRDASKNTVKVLLAKALILNLT